MEALAAAYGWSPTVINDLDLDELETWGSFAEQRLKLQAQSRCAWNR